MEKPLILLVGKNGQVGWELRRTLAPLAHVLAASGFTSWHGFASRIIELMPEGERVCHEVKGIHTTEYSTPAKRPAYSVLDCGKGKGTFGIQLPDWEESLRLVLDQP